RCGRLWIRNVSCMVSFIVPAHNEEAWIGRCLDAIRDAVVPLKESYEIIVVDDSSSDATASIARQWGARVLPVSHRKISATRNSGAKDSHGNILFFVDADTLINRVSLQSALMLLRHGAVGGGCIPRFDGILPLWWKVAYPLFVVAVWVFRQPGGSCLFCTR